MQVYDFRMLKKLIQHVAVISLCSVTGLVCQNSRAEDNVAQLPLKEIQELAQVLELIKKNHVTVKTDQELLVAAINGMLASLDNQSRYLTAEELKLFTRVATGSQRGKATTMGKMLADGIAYIDIDYFHASTADKVRSLWTELNTKTTKGLVIDVRDNPGGFVESAVAVSDLFLTEGLITTSRGRVAEASRNYSATATSLNVQVPIVILVNGQTASAAEILAAALQDYKLAMLVGTKTYGKGSIQSLMNTRHGAIQLTTSYYYSPKGRMIHENGLKPDILLSHEQGGSQVADDKEMQYHQQSASKPDWQLQWAINALVNNEL